MKKIMDKMERVKAWLHRPRTKKRIYAALVVLIALWVVGRFVMIGAENRLFVFNPARSAAVDGTVVQVMPAKRTTGALREPLTIKNNRAMVSGARIDALRVGQKVGDGTIVSIARGIDLDTGLHAVRTRGVTDGMNFAEYVTSGYFIPSYAITNGVLYVVSDGVATARNVHVARFDADTSVVTDGLHDGDIVILSRVTDGQKVQIKE